MCSDVVIEACDLGKRYGEYQTPWARLLDVMQTTDKRSVQSFTALANVSFEIYRGETVGIIGANGAGKSTLLQLLSGTVGPTAGAFRVKGRVAALLELGAGFNPDFTGRENLALVGALYGLTKLQIEQREPDVRAFAEIGDFFDKPVRVFSSGMFVRLAFSIIAHVDADILIIDEALAVGDALFTQKCMRFLRSFRQRGTLLFVSHDTSAVLALCDRAVWLERGELRLFGESKKVCEAYLAHVHHQSGKANKVFEHDSSGEELSQIPWIAERDMRSDFVNNSALRNDLEVFHFKDNGNDFGGKGFEIEDVCLLDEDGNRLIWVVGGEEVCIVVSGLALAPLEQPIFGFVFRSKYGQQLFGENTFLLPEIEKPTIAAGDRACAKFTFRMPILPAGEYVISVAVANGSQLEHVQEHWIHDALVIKSHSSSVSTGLLGVPMHAMSLSVST